MSNNIFICKICGKSYNGFFPVGKHLKRIHNMSVKEYYDKFIKTDENEGKCLNCGNPTYFHRISDGYLTYCSNRCQVLFQNKEKRENKQKIEQEKHEQCIKQFGEDTKGNRIKLSFKTRQDLTNSPAFINKIEKLYGVKYYCQTEKFKNEKAIRDFNNFKLKNDTNNIVFLNKNNGIYQCHCNICNNNFQLTVNQFSYRKTFNMFYCTYCLPGIKRFRISLQETELYKEIQKIYNKTIITNTRKIIKPKELDIYFPDIKLAIEYNGTYWHADPRFFKETDIVHGMIAKDIWERDNDKYELCNKNNIKLIIIKEYDWQNNKLNIIENLQKVINTLLGEYNL